VAQEGIARLEVAVPVLADVGSSEEVEEDESSDCGCGPHKKSATIEVVDDHATVLAAGRFGADTTGYRLMLGYVGRQWPDHRWAVEGANGVGRPLAQRLLADGETVVGVPAKLAARVRVFDTGNARKTDATDAHAVAMVAVRTPRLNQLAYDEELIALRLLTDRRDELSHLRVQTVNRLQRLLTELVPGGAKRDLSALQAKRILASVRPRTLVGKTMRRMAAEEITDLVAVDAKLKAIKTELRAAVTARGSHLMDLHGVGPAGAARILSDVGDVARFPDRNHFASWTGTAPLDASSGDQVRHRLSRAGNRRLNHVLHVAAIVQIRHDTEGRAYYRRKLAESKTPMEALRCLKRRLSDAIYRQLVADALATAEAAGHETGPGGHSGATPQSSAADLHTPVIGSSDKPQPGPAPSTLPRSRPRSNPRTASTASPPRRRAGAVKMERPTGRTTLTATSDGAHSTAKRPNP
jgi:transposase